AGLRPDAGTIAEQVFAAQRQQVVALVRAVVVVQGQLADAIQLQRIADALAIAQCGEQRFGRAGEAFLAHALQLRAQPAVAADPPVQGQLALLQRLPAAFRTRPAPVHAQALAELAGEFGAVLLDAQAGIRTRDRVPRANVAPPGANAPVPPRPAQLAEIRPRLDRPRLAVARIRFRVALDEAEAAVVRIEHRRHRRLGAALLDLQVGAAPGLQGHVDALQRIVVAAAVFVDVGPAQ